MLINPYALIVGLVDSHNLAEDQNQLSPYLQPVICNSETKPVFPKLSFPSPAWPYGFRQFIYFERVCFVPGPIRKHIFDKDPSFHSR